MQRKRVFVSFDYDNDRRYKYLLEAWDANPGFDFVFADATPREIDSTNVGRIKAGLTVKIKEATHTLVIVGKEANRRHRNSSLIGFRNWINFEIYQSKQLSNSLCAIRLDATCEWPEQLGGGVPFATGYTEDNVIGVLNRAKVV